MDSLLDHSANSDVRRQLARLGAGFFLAAVGLSSLTIGGDVLDMVIFLTINRANRAPLAADPEAALTLVGALPDAQRRAISINGVATWLDLPFETTRRHIRKMRDRGLCEIDARGVYIPAAVLTQPRFLAFADKNRRLVGDLVRDARKLGVSLPEVRHEVADLPSYKARLAADFLLDTFDVAGRGLGLSVMECLIFRAIAYANVEPVGLDPTQDLRSADPDGTSADRPLAPVTVYNLAKSLMLPYETARRHIWRLVEMGFVERAQKGFLVPPRIRQRPDVDQVVGSVAALFRDFVVGLAESGAGRDDLKRSAA